MKIEICFNPEAKEGEEEYTINFPKGVTPLRALAHLSRATAEGLLEVEEMLIDLNKKIEEAKGGEKVGV